MSTPAEPNPQEPRVIKDVVCTACGLLCDDLSVRIDGGRIVEASRACDRGQSWLLKEHQPRDRPEAIVDGRAVSLSEAIERASAILRDARAPMITGLTSATSETQSLCTLLADRLGAIISPAHAEDSVQRIIAVQRSGAVQASFGEVINRADVIVLWGVDPSSTHPRLRERLIDRPGRFVPKGRADRAILAVDSGLSECRNWADGAIAVAPGRHAEAILALRASVRAIAADPIRTERQSGVPLDLWNTWADRLRAARYGAIVFGADLVREGPATIEALMLLIDDLNRTTRCVAIPLAGPGNPGGAEAILTGRLGAPLAVDLADGIPRYRPFDADPSYRLLEGEADAVLVVGEPPDGLRIDASSNVASIRIGPNATHPSSSGHVAIATATPGIDEGGTFFRSDEVALPLRPPLQPIRPTLRAVLETLLRRCSMGKDMEQAVPTASQPRQVTGRAHHAG